MKKFALCLLCMAAALLLVVSCNSDHGVMSDSENSRHSGRTTLDEPWDQAGIDHNRSLAYVDERICKEYNREWNEEELNLYLRETVKTFFTDSTDYDKDIIEAASAIELIPDPGFDEMRYQAELLKENGYCTDRELEFMLRLCEFLCNPDLDCTMFEEGMKAFTDEVLVTDWDKEFEFTALGMTAIANHSYAFHIAGWQFDPGDFLDRFNFWRCLRADVAGYMVGRQFGGNRGGAIGAGVASACDAINQIRGN
jgi:hypothetical protein